MEIDTKGLKLGDEVLDPITGLKGRIIGFTQWFSGCAVATVQPPMAEKAPGKVPATMGFDVTRLELVSKPVEIDTQRQTGGPQLDPPTTR